MLPPTLALNHADNLITLCGNCHAAYDSEYPAWIMVPTTNILNRYIQHERDNYEYRVAAAAVGQIVPRSLPGIDKNNVAYHRFVLDPVWGVGHPINQHVKNWAGEPTAVIFKALRGLAQPCTPITRSRMDGTGEVRIEMGESIRTKNMTLVRLWSRPAPVVTATSDEKGGQGSDQEDGGGGIAGSGMRPLRKRKAVGEGRTVVHSKRVRRDRTDEQQTVRQRILEWRDRIPC